MGLFERKRSVGTLGDQDIQAIKQQLGAMLDIAKSYDRTMASAGLLTVSLEGRMRGDLLAFTLYLAGADKTIKPQEVEVVNRIFDIDLSHVDFELFRKDVGNTNFEHAIPPSILILKELGNRLQAERAADANSRAVASALCEDLINVYALIGSALLSADGQVSERESADLIRYLTMISEAALGQGAGLPKGAAQRTLAAHKRLFGTLRRL